MKTTVIGSRSALKHLSLDMKMAKAIKYFDPISPGHDDLSHFASLCRWIIGQQLSGSAASTIFKRFNVLVSNDGEILPETVLTIPDSKLRCAGISGGKVSYVKNLSALFCEGILSERTIILGNDQEIRNRLVQVKGIGNWTADMFMMFKLRRPDIFPINDAGIKKGYRILYRKDTNPSDEQLIRHSKRWAPHRTTASLYLWKIADTTDIPFKW